MGCGHYEPFMWTDGGMSPQQHQLVVDLITNGHVSVEQNQASEMKFVSRSEVPVHLVLK